MSPGTRLSCSRWLPESMSQGVRGGGGGLEGGGSGLKASPPPPVPRQQNGSDVGRIRWSWPR